MIFEGDEQNAVLAARYAPQLMLDRAEPYAPVAFGYSIFRAAGKSPSSTFDIEPAGALVVEYAIYYDWDIGHLYDLEHVWVHVDAQGAVLLVEASAHGGRRVMDAGAGGCEMSAGRPRLYVEAGKHAHWARPDRMNDADTQKLAALCGPLAGIEGVHQGNAFAQRGDYSASAGDHRLARLKMRRDAFVPSLDYAPAPMPTLLPWAQLAASIPDRVRAELVRLSSSLPHFGAIFLDCGDTLIDERSEVKLPGSDVVIDGELIPGADDMVRALKDAGYRLVLVADGPRKTFVNLLGKHGLWSLFDAHVISEDIGALKPDERMFDAALAAVGLGRSDAWRCVMVGNNLARDIKGANGLGMASVLMAWSTLRSHEPANTSEVPDYRIGAPMELVNLVNQLEPLLAFNPQWHEPATPSLKVPS